MIHVDVTLIRTAKQQRLWNEKNLARFSTKELFAFETNPLEHNQLDQIGLFLKGFGDKFRYKSGPKIEKLMKVIKLADDSKHRSKAPEATTLPTAPQPLPKLEILLKLLINLLLKIYSNRIANFYSMWIKCSQVGKASFQRFMRILGNAFDLTPPTWFVTFYEKRLINTQIVLVKHNGSR